MTNQHYEPKPGTLEHVIQGAEKTINQQQGLQLQSKQLPILQKQQQQSNSNADENILSDVLRLISFNIPSGRNRAGGGESIGYISSVQSTSINPK